MTEKINIAEILKECPKGMELYSPLCGKCVFDRLNFGTIICKKQNTQEITFTSNGYYMLPVFDDCECMIFPSKDQRDWSKFVPPCKFKEGDVVVAEDDKSLQLFLLKHLTLIEDDNSYDGYCYFGWDFQCNKLFEKGNWGFNRLATEEEKKKLFDAIKGNGYNWNPETKTLEKLPKFKVGDRIRSIISNSGYIYNVIEIKESLYVVSKNDEDDNKLIDFKIQDYWELVPNKFDITTLVPFESEVLVRDNNLRKWSPAIWGYYDCDSQDYPYKIIGGCARYCIPYEGNYHLLGTTEDCDEYYKTWEK